MISASLPGEALAQLGHLSHLYPHAHAHAAAPPPPSMTPEFLAPPPRPYARYAPRPRTHPHPRDLPPPAPAAASAPAATPSPPSAAPAFPPVPGAYARFLPHPVSYAPYLYRPPAPAPAPVQPVPVPAASAYPLRPRPTSGFVPPAPAPRSPPAAACSPAAGTAGADRGPSSSPAAHFCRGALIRLEDGSLRRVEDMRTEDFVASAERCGDLALTHCTLLRLEERGEQLSLTLAYDGNRSQVELESTVEHPFFVYGRGWASCSPERTQLRYGLRVRRLQVGDVCVSLTPRRPSPAPANAPPPPPQTHPENLSVREDAHKRRWSASDACHDDRPPHKKR